MGWNFIPASRDHAITTLIDTNSFPPAFLTRYFLIRFIWSPVFSYLYPEYLDSLTKGQRHKLNILQRILFTLFYRFTLIWLTVITKSQLTFTSLKSTIEPLCLKFYCQLWTYFTPFSDVSIVDFEQVNVSWDSICMVVVISNEKFLKDLK